MKAHAEIQRSAQPSRINQPFFQRNKSNPFYSSNAIQLKPVLGKPNDSYEQEADRVADAVVSGEKAPSPATGISTLQRKCDACEEEDVQAKLIAPDSIQRKGEEEEEAVQAKLMPGADVLQKQSMEEEEEAAQAKPLDNVQRKGEEEEEALQAKSNDTNPSTVSTTFASQLSGSSGNGSSLPKAVQAKMSNHIGADFSSVRIHTNSQAAEMSQSIQAKAFTHGNNIYFNKGQYNPETKTGQHLLAHELTHTVQQGAVRRMVQRDLAIEHPNPGAVARQLSLQEITDAISFNTTSLRNNDEIMVLRDVLGMSHDAPTIDAALIEAVAQYQAENDIGVDGKIGRVTASRLTREFSAESRNVGGRSGDRELFNSARRMGTRSFSIRVNQPGTIFNNRGQVRYGVMWNVSDRNANGYIIQHVRFVGNITNCANAAVASRNSATQNNYWEAWRVVNGQVNCGNLAGSCTGSDDTFTPAREPANTKGTISITGRVNYFPDYRLTNNWVTTGAGVHRAGALPHRASQPGEWSEGIAKTHSLTVRYDDCATPKTTTFTTNP